ncbi:MAG TPA: ROK family protein [Isosphaeraceae bacterium]
MSTPLFLGVEFGGTKLQLGLGAGDGRLLALERRSVRPERGATGIREQFVEAAKAVLGRVGGDASQVGAVGIGFGGPIDSARGVVTVSNQVEGWTGFPIVAWMREVLGVRQVVLANDADTAALGEARFGAGVGCNPVLYVTIGSGVGGGLVVDGAIYRGSGRGAIEIGHLAVDCTCQGDNPSAIATLESKASGWSIARRARELLDLGAPSPLVRLCDGKPSRISAELIARAATEGDGVARMILGEAQGAMGQALGHAINLLAPQRIILGGGVSLIGEQDWFGPIRRATERWVFPPFRGSYDILPAGLGEDVVVHGGLALARDVHRAGGGG